MVSQQIIQDQTSSNEEKKEVFDGKTQDESFPNRYRKDSALNEENEGSRIDKKEGASKVNNFDPDEDNFEFGIEKATMLHKNINILQFIRKTLMPGNFKLFDANSE